jgi:hypothetical protein
MTASEVLAPRPGDSEEIGRGGMGVAYEAERLIKP